MDRLATAAHLGKGGSGAVALAAHAEDANAAGAEEQQYDYQRNGDDNLLPQRHRLPAQFQVTTNGSR